MEVPSRTAFFHDEIAMKNDTLNQLQSRLGYRFQQEALLQRALTHRSFGADHNERLEFLGDAVLSATISSLLYSHYGASDEGDLTRVRAHLVRQETLHQLAVQLQLSPLIRMSEGEAKSGGAQRPSILADALEALIGAMFMDGGFEPAQKLVNALFSPLLGQTVASSWSKDAKTALQEWLQAKRFSTPVYEVKATRGKQHDQVFVVACRVMDCEIETIGEGRSRRLAEQAAAQIALEKLCKTTS